MEQETTEDYSPYCPDCDACGEDGCCSALNCKHTSTGHYCQSYLKELQFGYYMWRWFSNNISSKLPQELTDPIDKEWDEAYDRFFTQ